LKILKLNHTKVLDLQK